MEDFDLIVIGAGPGGYVAAIRAAQLGMKVACIEKEPSLGGTCLNIGCIPSKALLNSSEKFVEISNHAAEHGIKTSKIDLDLNVLMDRKTKIVKKLTTGIGFLFKKNKITHIPGMASFVDKNTISITNGKNEITASAKNFIIATGSSSIEIPNIPVDEKKIVSSTIIRNLLEKGNLNRANKFLGREWTIDGIVQKGRQVGKKIGFPTCNIDIKDYVLAQPGVYAVRVLRKKSQKKLNGIANLGYRPTFNQKKILLEVHLFNFSGNLYNKLLSVQFLKFIRKEKKFKNVDQLRRQIKSDLNIAKKTK